MEHDVLLEMKNISKEFPGVKALDNVSLTVRRGTVHALMGENGAGKSTLMKCLFGMYVKDGGSISLEGKEINFKNSKEALENGVAMVHQELNQCLERNVIDNLCYGKKNASIDEINHALKVAQADFISKMPDGLNARVLQGGKNLSGGQRQRLSIARAILKNSPVLVLDDSSSALDYQTDYKLRMAIKELKKTTFIISQRASSIAYADQIIVLDNGKIDAIGCHDELLEKSKLYREICISQEMSVKEVTINEE